MRKLLTLLLLLGFLANSHSQTWTNYLKHSEVNDFFEEEDQLWIATNAGIFIIDKSDHSVEHWTKFNAGLPSNRIEEIARHPETGQLFIGTYDVGIALKTAEGWASIAYPEDLMENQPSVLTYCFDWDAAGRLWVGTDKGLLRYEEEEWTVLGQEGPTEFLFAVWDMDKDLDGNLMVAGNVLLRISGDSLELLTPVDFINAESLFAYSSAHFKMQENGVFWFFTDIGTVGRFEGDSVQVFSSFVDENPIAFNLTQFIAEDEAGHLWAYLDGWGFYRYDEAWESASFGENVEENNLLGLHFMEGDPLFIYPKEAQLGLNTENRFDFPDYPFEGPLTNFKYDWDGNLWIKDGSHALLQPDDSEIHQLQNAENPLVFSDYTIAPDGSIWLISGQSIYHQTEAGWELHNHSNSELPDVYGFRYIVASSDGYIWIHIADKGIYYFDGEAWDRYFLPIPVADYINSMIAGVDGNIWFTVRNTYTGSKVVRANKAEYKIYKDSDIGLEDAFFSELFFERENNRLWLITSEGEIVSFENGDWEFESLAETMPDLSFIHGIMVYNNLVAVHSIRQIALFQNGEWRVLDKTNAPISDDSFADIGLDQTGQLWISHYGNRGAVEIFQTGVISSDAEVPASEVNFTISPNPATTNLKIQLDLEHNAGPVNIRMYNLNGQLLKVYEVDAPILKEGLNLSVEQLQAGIYYLEIDAGKRIGKRFLKL